MRACIRCHLRETIRRCRAVVAVLAVGALAQTVSRSVDAADPDFQDFFLQNACDSPIGELAVRCTEWTGVVGDLSGDSESSLNPSQGLSSNDTPLERALNYSKEAREHGEEMLEEDVSTDAAVQFGRLSLSFQVHGSSYETDRIADVDAERSLEGDYYGATVGFDYRISDRAFLGLQLGIDRIDQDFVGENTGTNFAPEPTAGGMKGDTISMSLIGSVNFTDRVYFLGTLGYGESELELYRNAIFQESGRTPDLTRYVNTRGDTDGDQTWASLNLGIDLGRGTVSFGPYFGLAYATSSVDAFTEREIGPDIWGLGMGFSATERDSLQSHAGFRADLNRSTESGVLSVQFRVEYQHEGDKDPDQVTTYYLLDGNQSQFSLVGDTIDRSQAEIAFGLLKVMPGGWQPYFDLAVLTGNDFADRYRWAAGFRKQF